jgi:dihydrofolate reductase
MRKLKLQVQVTVDGFIAGPNGEMDWMVWDWDDELLKCVKDLTEPVDCILLGRKMAEGFIPYWEKVAANPEDPSHAFGKKMNDTPRVVFSNTIKKSEWNNAVIANGELSEEISKLKNLKGNDIIVYGGSTFVSGLIKAGLIDEFNLFVNPVAIGSGMTIFKSMDSKLDLDLVKSISFTCGIVLLNYIPKK